LITRVWREFAEIDADTRIDEMFAAITALLGINEVRAADAEQALNSILHNRNMRYRVAVTAPVTAARANSYAHLFAGYELAIPHHLNARMAEFIALPDVRGFLNQLAIDVIAALDEMERTYVR
ncbi:MAG TPA: hypothetical protein VKQ27_17090, partial [Acetobacteraceae bacterium]|nr:hypothetical protein [Acetobacteraceae bacterium]